MDAVHLSTLWKVCFTVSDLTKAFGHNYLDIHERASGTSVFMCNAAWLVKMLLRTEVCAV